MYIYILRKGSDSGTRVAAPTYVHTSTFYYISTVYKYITRFTGAVSFQIYKYSSQVDYFRLYNISRK
jgi:hypothetical protein